MIENINIVIIIVWSCECLKANVESVVLTMSEQKKVSSAFFTRNLNTRYAKSCIFQIKQNLYFSGVWTVNYQKKSGVDRITSFFTVSGLVAIKNSKNIDFDIVDSRQIYYVTFVG